MDLDDVRAAHLRLGVDPVRLDDQVRTRLDDGRWTRTPVRDPSSDRPPSSETFADENALARRELVDLMLARPQSWPDGGSTDPGPRPVTIAAAAAPVGAGPPRLLWSRDLTEAPRSMTPADLAGEPFLLLVDTAAVWRHGVDGALACTAHERDHGEVRWSVPVRPDPRRVWLPARDTLVHHAAGRLDALAHTDGRRAWSRVWPDPVTHLATAPAGAPDVVVLATGPPDREWLGGVDATTGELRWQRWTPPPLTRPRPVPDADVPALRFAEAHVTGDRVRVAGLDAASGEERTLLEAPTPVHLPPGRTVLLADRLDAAGLALLEHRPAGARAVDGGYVALLAQQGATGPVVTPLHPPDGRRAGRRVRRVDDETLLWSSPFAREPLPTSLVGLDGVERWRRPENLGALGRVGPLTALSPRTRSGERAAGDRGVLVLDDDGRERWSLPRGRARVVAEEVWVHDQHRLAAHDLATGAQRWVTTADDIGVMPYVANHHVEVLARARLTGRPVALHGHDALYVLG